MIIISVEDIIKEVEKLQAGEISRLALASWAAEIEKLAGLDLIELDFRNTQKISHAVSILADSDFVEIDGINNDDELAEEIRKLIAGPE